MIEFAWLLCLLDDSCNAALLAIDDNRITNYCNYVMCHSYSVLAAYAFRSFSLLKVRADCQFVVGSES